MQRGESAIEDVVSHPAALDDAFRLVERPVNAKVNSTLAIFFFRLGKSRETARHVGANNAVIPPGNSVELIRDKREAEPVRSIKSTESLEQRPAKTGVT